MSKHLTPEEKINFFKEYLDGYESIRVQAVKDGDKKTAKKMNKEIKGTIKAAKSHGIKIIRTK